MNNAPLVCVQVILERKLKKKSVVQLYLYDMNHTFYELNGIYHILISDQVERGKNILIDDELTYNDNLWINYLSNSNTPLTIDFDFDVLQKLPVMQIEIHYTLIYVTAGFVGGVGVTILGVVIRNHYLKKRNRVHSISSPANEKSKIC